MVFEPLQNPSELLDRLIVSAGLQATAAELEQEMENVKTAAGQLPQGDVSGSIDQAMQALNDLYQLIRGLTQPPFPGDFARLLVDYLVADYLRNHQAAFYHLASLFGWIRYKLDEDEFDPDVPYYAAQPVQWERTPAFFTRTAQEFSEADHRWSRPEFADRYSVLLYHLGKWLDVLHGNFSFPMGASDISWGDETLTIPLLAPSHPDIAVDFDLDLSLLAQADGPAGIQMNPRGSAELDLEIQLTNNPVKPQLFYLLEAGVEVGGGIALHIFPDRVSLVQADVDLNAHVLQGLRVQKNGRIVLMGTAEGNRVDLKSIAVKGGLRIATGQTMEFLTELSLAEGRIVIGKAGGDGFLNALLPKDGIQAQFDLTVGWSNQQGIYFGGSAGLEIKLPAHIELGPVEIQGISLGIKPKAGAGQEPGFELPVGADVQLLLGPFTAVVQEMGIRLFISYRETSDGSGSGDSETQTQLGPLYLEAGFKPPKGIGLSLETPTIKGGGYLFFDFDKGEYAGVAELVIKELVAVKAIGIVTTKKPDGSPGFSFLLLITAEFKPIQLGYGFTLNGVGGLIAINRGMNLEALAEGVRTNAIDAVMFPDDPVAEAPRIIADLNQFFPVAEGRYTFGLMAILGWGTPTLIAVEMGLIIQVPDPVVLAILGVVRVELPDKAAPVLKLQVNFIGAIDFEQGYMFFFAALFESRLLQYQLEGEMYFTISWGDQPNFIFTVGGFHPAFKAPALPNLSGPLKRLTLNLLPTDNPRLTLKAYFAVTANTVQFGASIDFYFKVSEFRVVGYLYLDALFQFNPFYFIVEVGAGLSVMLGGAELLGIHLKGTLSGPTPWHIKGKASFRILFVKIKVRVSKRFGKEQKKILPPRPMLPDLLEALRDLRNWEAELPRLAQLQVSFRELPEEELILHPAGVLSVRQSRIPLNFYFDKVGNERPSDYGSFSFQIDPYPDATLLKDNFAPAEFLRLSDSERLSRNSFERLQSGLKVAGGDAFFSAASEDAYVARDYEFEQLIIDGPDFFAAAPESTLSMEQEEYERFLRSNAVALSPQGRLNALKADQPAPPVQQAGDQYGIATIKDLRIVKQNDVRLLFGSEAEALQALRAIETTNPQLARRYQVMPVFEIEDL